MKKTLLTCISIICLTFSTYAQPEYDFGPEITINTVPTGTNPYVIGSGDLSNDLDKWNDIVIGTLVGGTVEIYFNNGDGTWALPPTTFSIPAVSGIHVVDWDGVNGVDILVSAGNRLVWYQNNGSGTFTLQVPDISSTVNGAAQVSTADINNDTILDIVLAVYDGGGATDRVVWFQGTGGGGYMVEQEIADLGSPIVNGGPGAFGIGQSDIDGDADLDIVIGYTDATSIEVYVNQFVESGTSTVSWVKQSTVHTGDSFLFVAGFADYNDDGTLDIIKTDVDNTGSDDVAWYDGANSFMENFIPYSTMLDYPGIIVPTDINEDGYSDFFISNGSNTGDDIILLQSSGPGTYYPGKTISDEQIQVFGATINDFNGDDLLDIASVDYQNEEVNWFANLGEPLSVPSNSLNEISIYPNPASSELYFRGLTNDIEVSVYNMLGAEIHNATIQSNSSLDVSKLQSGVYILKVKDYNKTFKFVKK